MLELKRPQRPLSKAEAVYETLRAAILEGALAPGEHLRQDEVAARWEVSSTPVREAFRRLESEGLVELVPHRGVRVTANAMSPAQLPLVSAAELEPGSDFP
jgi:DNA-binding GntR family transcriptional regulator